MRDQLGLFDQPAPEAPPPTAALRHFKVRDETPEEALEGERRANTQEARVLELFRGLPAGTRLTPWEVSERLELCVNSARRALSNLVDVGELVDHRADRRPSGPFGQRSRTWSLPA